MKRLLAILTLTGFAVVGFSAVATAGKTDHYTCHHGNSNKTCKPDPQPSHGKDCNHPHFGINQDHCSPAPSPSSTVSPEPSTSPTASPTDTPSATPTPNPGGKGSSGVPRSRNSHAGPLAKTGVPVVLILWLAALCVVLGVVLLSGPKKR